MVARWVVAVVIAMGAVARAAAGDKPPVPIGVDPGGVAVAIVGPGIDYTDRDFARRLARDGEGEIVGFDLIDGDRRPYGVEQTASHRSFQSHVVALLLDQQSSRIAVFRADAAQRVSLARAISYVSKGPARIVFLPGGFPESPAPDFAFLAAASKQFPELLFVVPAGDQAAVLDGLGVGDLLNVVVVTAVASVANGGTGKANRGAAVDLAALGELTWAACDAAGCAPVTGSYSQIAAARVAGLAAKLSAETVGLGGAALKRAIVALAQPDAAATTRFGVIAKTGADFRAK